MAELADLVPVADVPLTVRRARVISISGRQLTVDIGGPVVIGSLDSCNPMPNQWVFIIGEGTSMMAIGAVGGPYRQATLTVVSQTTDTVTGLVNGVSRTVGKTWAFTATAGDVLPLLWSPDGSNVSALGLPGAAYVPPSGGGGGGSNPGGGTTTHTSYYAPVSSGYSDGGETFSGSVRLSSGVGYYQYGVNRMNELQGRTIVSASINLLRIIGSGSVTLTAYKGGTLGSSSVATGGWVALPTARATDLVNGTGATTAHIVGSGTLKGVPDGGTIQIVWR